MRNVQKYMCSKRVRVQKYRKEKEREYLMGSRDKENGEREKEAV